MLYYRVRANLGDDEIGERRNVCHVAELDLVVLGLAEVFDNVLRADRRSCCVLEHKGVLAADGRAKPLAIGVGHPVGALATIYPQPHDIPMDWIVTAKPRSVVS